VCFFFLILIDIILENFYFKTETAVLNIIRSRGNNISQREKQKFYPHISDMFLYKE